MIKQPFFRTIGFALAEISDSPTEIAQRLGLKTDTYRDDLGPVISTGMQLKSGQAIAFQLRLEQTGILTVIYADESDVLVAGVQALLGLVLDEIGVSASQLLWVQHASAVEIIAANKAKARVWKVKRLDDNGNTFVLAEGLRKSQAEEVVADYTARGHKQLYWAEK